MFCQLVLLVLPEISDKCRDFANYKSSGLSGKRKEPSIPKLQNTSLIRDISDRKMHEKYQVLN